MQTAKKVHLRLQLLRSSNCFTVHIKAQNQKVEKEKITQAITGIQIIGMDEAAAEKFGELMSTLDKAGQKVADRDVMIAAIALANEEQTIVTRNKKDFDRIPNLKVITY